MNRLVTGLMFLAGVAGAQQLPLENWQQKLKSYYTLHPPVKLHLQFNQPAYAPGDTAFFRIAYIVAAEAAPLKGFTLAEVQVVDAEGNVVIHQFVRIRDGWGNNQLILPENMLPGNYRVIAYDNWMKNFDRSRYFEGELLVSGENLFSQQATASLACFPEGGRLVAGVRNKIVVQAANANAKGTVTDARGNKVADFSADQNGYGMFFLTPEQGISYTVQSDNRTAQLAAADDGVAVLFTPSASLNASHRLVLQVPAESALRKERLNVVVSGHAAVYYSASFIFNDKEFIYLPIPVTALAHGICYLTVNRENGETLASRIFFNRKSKVNVIIEPDKKQPTTRDDVKVGIALTDEENNSLLARMSVSVYQADVFPAVKNIKRGIGDYFSWISDLNEAPPSEFEVNLQAADGLTMIDRMLISKAWPWYTWDQVLHHQAKPRFLFRGFQQITGRLVEVPSGKPFADSVQLSFYVTGTRDVYEVFSKKDGSFSVSFLFPFYGQEMIFYRVERAGRRLDFVKIELTDSLPQYPAKQWVRTATPNPYYAYAQKRKKVNTSYSYFSRGSIQTPKAINRNAEIEKELLEPDVSVDLDDYVIFPTMQETLHEIVPYLQYRRIAGRDVVRLYLPELAQTGAENPLFVIDGVFTDDPAYFLKLKPIDVDKIKLIYTQYKLQKLGAIGKHGVVLVETKIPDNAKKVATASRTLTVNGISPPIPVSSNLTGWQKANPRAPQLKSWLYWNPLLRSDENGKARFAFKTTDETGQYIIRVEGLTVEGVPFVQEEYLEVKYTRSF